MAESFHALSDEHLETLRFTREHGVVPIEERRADLLLSLNDEERSRLEEIEKDVDVLVEQLKATPEINRLHGLYQLGGKVKPQSDLAGLDGHDQVIGLSPAFHTRYQHSELDAELVKFAAIKLKLSLAEVKAVVAAAWLHDIGHPAFSHATDVLLEGKGEGDHEDRAQKTIRNPEGIGGVLSSNGTDVNLVSTIMEEKGALGQLQSLCDTLSYLVVDTQMLQYDYDYQNSGANPIRSLKRTEGDSLVVDNVAVWQKMIEDRAKMMRDVYCHPVNRRSDEALRQLLRIALELGEITPGELKNGTDDKIRLKLQSLVQSDRGAALLGGRKDMETRMKDFQDLYGISLGFYDAEHWNFRVCDDYSEVIRVLDKLPADVVKKSFVCPPFDYTKKTITVLSDDRSVLKENKLHAEETGLREDDKKFIVYYPNVEGVTNPRPTADELDDLMVKSIILGEQKRIITE